MKLRITGTLEECNFATNYYKELRNDPTVAYVEISKPYANRGDSQLYRIYIEAVYKQFDSDKLKIQ